MPDRRQVEIFSAGCPVCEDVIDRVNDMACPSCEITVRDMKDTAVAARAASLGIRSVPSVVIDGKIAACCTNRDIDEEVLRAAGLGQPLP